MSLDKCNETCGYVAAISAAVCLGSFGVPVKSEVVKRLDVDPLVVQVRRIVYYHIICNNVYAIIIMHYAINYSDTKNASIYHSYIILLQIITMICRVIKQQCASSPAG